MREKRRSAPENVLFGLGESALFTTHAHSDSLTHTHKCKAEWPHVTVTRFQSELHFTQKPELQFQNTPNAKPANGILSGTFEIFYPRSGRGTQRKRNTAPTKTREKVRESETEKGWTISQTFGNCISWTGEARMGITKPRIRWSPRISVIKQPVMRKTGWGEKCGKWAGKLGEQGQKGSTSKKGLGQF